MTDPGLPKIIGMLCWYDESPAWLAAAVTSIAPFVDHLVAVDGGYQFFPGAMERPCSRNEEAQVIFETAHAAGMGLTLYRPNEPFEDNEVGKRSLALDLCYNVAREQDWIFIFDADEVVRYAAEDLKHKLAETECLVATYGLVDYLDAQKMVDHYGNDPNQGWETESVQQIRDLHRAVPGLHYEDAHYVLATTWPDGQKKYFRGHGGIHKPFVEAFNATKLLLLDHRQKQRHRERDEKRLEFYRRRDQFGLETFHTYEMEGLDGKPVQMKPTHEPTT